MSKNEQLALCERICAAIKAADDKSTDEAGYMLDSNDCIKIVREHFSATGDDFSGVQPPMRHIPGVRVDLLRRATPPQPTMSDAIAAGDSTLHGAVDYWQQRALRAEAAQPAGELVAHERTAESATINGRYTAYPQRGTPGHCYLAQVFGPDGKSVATFDSTNDSKHASRYARTLADALNAPQVQRAGLSEAQMRVLMFLWGAGNLRGVGFGSQPEGDKRPFWWRNELREAFPEIGISPAGADTKGMT